MGPPPGAAEAHVLEQAHVFCYRLFDVADEIDLDAAQSLLARDTGRVRLTRAGAKYLLLPNPPLAVDLGRRTLLVDGGPLLVEVVSRLFDHGSVSIRFRVPIKPGTHVAALIPLARELYENPAVDGLAMKVLQSLLPSIAAALRGGGQVWEQSESYAVHFVERIQGSPSAAEVLAWPELAPLLLGETREPRLSAREQSDVTAQHFSYGEQDLVVVDWNAAFVYEPTGSPDIPDILEICNGQLLEFRFYDNELDQQLTGVAETLRRTRRRGFPLFGSTDAPLARRVQLTLIEMSEALERVENSLKIIGDFYLAKVYEAALEQLRVDDWKASVQRKQQTLGDVYQWLKGEVDTARSLTLELMIVVLIVVEVVLAFLRH
jgi:hypothetical protein